MNTPPTPTHRPSIAELHEQNARTLCALLLGMAEQGAELAAACARQMSDAIDSGKPGAGPSPECTAAYNVVTRSVRQTALLVQKLTTLAPAAKAAPDPVATRKQIIRTVEDAIDHHAPLDHAERLRAELAERLEIAEVEDEVATRPVGEIIDEIRRDLGVCGEHSLQIWKRRTPADIAALNALAAAPYRKAGAPFAPQTAQGGDLAKMPMARPRDDTWIRGP